MNNLGWLVWTIGLIVITLLLAILSFRQHKRVKALVKKGRQTWKASRPLKSDKTAF